jgi:hypothetical protein
MFSILLFDVYVLNFLGRFNFRRMNVIGTSFSIEDVVVMELLKLVKYRQWII